MFTMRIKASVPGMGGSEGTMGFETLMDAIKYVSDDMFYGPEKPYMAIVKEDENDTTLLVTHGGMSFAINIKEKEEDNSLPKELGE